MKKNRLLALMLVLGLILSGCTGKQGSGTGTSEAPSGITAAADETGTAAETEQETESSETETEASAADSSETPGDTESTGEDDFWQEIHDTFDDFAEKDFEGTDVDGGFLRTGQFPEADLVKPEVLGDPELAEMDRAMRAYRAKGDPEIINNAPGFFYYDHFDDGKRAIYDALYELAQDPTTTDHIVALKTDRDIQSDEFEQDFYTVWMAIACDHPELWWMYLWNGEVAFEIALDNLHQNSAARSVVERLALEQAVPEFSETGIEHHILAGADLFECLGLGERADVDV